MKTLISLAIFAFLWINMVAQTPQALNYQAVARNSSGQVLANQAVSFKISILSGSATGTAVYSETHTGKTTNQFGLVNLAIGTGTPVTGTLSAVAWDTGTYYVKVEMDPAGGSSYQALGTSQLLSVPYALHSKTVELEADGDPANEIQELQLSGTVLGLTKSSKTVTLPSSGGGDNWGTQVVKTDATLTGDGTDASPLGIVSSAATPEWNDILNMPADFADGIDDVDDADHDPQNEIQELSLVGNVLTLSLEGGSVELPSAGSGPFVSGNGITRNTVLTDNFVFGSPSLDDIAGSDDDRRMFFSKDKGAFRAGSPYGTNWDGSNVGIYSAAFGRAKASGILSFAAGHNTTASGEYSTALGAVTNALGNGSTALGGETKAVGFLSTSMGYRTTATARSSLAIGEYNIGSGDATYWVSTDPVFEIGIGNSETEKANAVTVLKNGNVGIGQANPTARMEVAGQVKITGGNPGAGKVLTSDPNGLASWQNPSGESLWQANSSNIYYNSGNVGIGTTSPAALLHTHGTASGQGNVVFVGEYKTSSPGNPPVSGAGTRMMWYPDKAAFRAGHVDGTQWDASNIGTYSIAAGNSTTASGSYSMAIGGLTTASGSYSAAIGQSATASGIHSFSVGYSTTASGVYSTARGDYAVASGNYSTAIGQFITAPSYFETVIGCYNNNYTPASSTSWDNNDRLFVISNGTGQSSRRNAFTILKNGKIGIGTDTPGYLLDVAGNSRIRLIDGSEWIALRNDGSSGLLDLSFGGGTLVIQGTAAGENILINPGVNSKVGIRSWAAPLYELDVNGSIRATGSVYYGGTAGNANGTEYSKPDYVFEKSYEFLSIEEIEKFIVREQHLPWITSAEKEKKENGDAVDMTRMAFETVETIENMQLQIIELNKQLKAMNKLIFHQQKEIEELKKLK